MKSKNIWRPSNFNKGDHFSKAVIAISNKKKYI
jgi:hypothetical protein